MRRFGPFRKGAIGDLGLRHEPDRGAAGSVEDRYGLKPGYLVDDRLLGVMMGRGGVSLNPNLPRLPQLRFADSGTRVDAIDTEAVLAAP